MANQLNDYLQIRVKGLSSCFKEGFFEDRKYLKGYGFERIPNDVIVFDSEESFKTVNFPNIYLTVPIASISFEQNLLEILSSENIEVSQIEACERIQVIDNNGILNECKIIGVEKNKPDSYSTLYQYLITCQIIYRYSGGSANGDLILNEDTYNDHVTSTYLLDNYDNIKLWRLSLWNYENVDSTVITTPLEFYTKFYPKLDTVETKLSEQELANGDKVVNKIQSFTVYKCRFYLTETEMINMKKYAKFCHYKDEFGNNYGNTLDNGHLLEIYAGIKPIEFEFPEKTELQNIGIHECNVTFFVSKINYSPQLNKV